MRKVLDSKNVSEEAKSKIESFHNDIVNEVEEAIQQNECVVVGMAHNPHCSKACKLLKEKGIKYKYIEYGSYFTMWKHRLALKLWSGWPTFPMVFMKGQLIGGRADLKKYLETQ